MIDIIKKFFQGERDRGKGLKQGGEHDVRVATCAILLEMAYIDGEFTDQERENVLSILKRNFRLSGEHADALLEAAAEELRQSIDLWRFARLINRNYSMDEKLRVIEKVWEVVYADKRLDKHEDYLMHKLAQLLRLSQKQLTDAKLRVKDRLDLES